MKGFLVGSLGLIVLYSVVTIPASADRIGSLATAIAGAINRATNPTVPLIPDLTKKKKTSSSTSSSSTAPATFRNAPTVTAVPTNA